MQKKNCVSLLLCAAVFAFFLFKCSSLSDAAAYWPRIICIVGLTLCALKLAIDSFTWYHTKEKQEKLWVLSTGQSKRALILLGIMVLWCMGLNTVGFLVTSLIALCAVAICFEPKKTKRYIVRDVIACLVVGTMVYFLFGYLGVHYPRALLI